MLSIQKITGFVNDCMTFRQKTTFYATSSGLFSTRAQVRPSGRISPAAVSAILFSVGPASIWLCGNRTKPQAVPIPPYKKYSGCVRKGRTKRENAAQPEKTHIRPVYYPPRQKATGIWSPGKELLSGIQKKLLPSSLRDATHSPSGTFVPPPPAGGVFLTEGGSGEKERCSILPKAPSLRELARRKT